MNIPKELKYSKSHEWVQETDDGAVRIGLTDHAQSEMGDLVFIDLPTVGDELHMGETFADVESVKAVSDVYSPVSGIVAAVNEDVMDNPALINADCYGAWLVEARDVTETEDLLDAAAYEALVAKEG